MPRGDKTHNEYSESISVELFDRTPKTVFAAIAISYTVNLLNSDLEIESIDAQILSEWKTLYEQGIIPQKPPTKVR